MLKKKMTIAIFLFFTIIIYGFVCVSSSLPGVIKNNSRFKVIVNKKPFELEFDIGDYVVHINDKPIAKLKEKTQSIFKIKSP